MVDLGVTVATTSQENVLEVPGEVTGMAALKCITGNVCQYFCPSCGNCANEVSQPQGRGKSETHCCQLVVGWMQHQDPGNCERWVCWIPLQG